MPRRRDPKPAMRSRRGPPRSRPRLPPGDRDRRLAEEVLYLHSLWRRGPPAPAPTQSRSAGRIATERKRRRLDGAAAAAEPQDTGPEWALAQPPPNSSPKTWPEAAPASSPSPAKPPPPPPSSPGALAQREALRAAAEFFSNRGSSDDEEEDDDGSGSESEGEQDAAGFITDLFEKDAALRGHYERGWEEGQFACMACAGGTRKPGRLFRGCVALVQHARAATRYGRPRAHRALAAVVCRVLGWDIARLPSIVIDPRGTLGQALAARATADVQPAKENDDTGDDNDSLSDEDEDEEEEEIEKEDGYPSDDGDEEDNELENSEDSAEKENVEKGTEDSRNTVEEEEDIELDNGEKSAEKEELEEKGSWEISKNEVLRNESVQEAMFSINLVQVNASKDDSLNQGNNEEVRRQEIAKESSEQENTNNTYLPGSKDICKNEERCKEAAVQERDDTGDTAVTSLGNSSTVPPSSSVLYQKSQVSGLNVYMP
ncbi:hypothetical protein C2845_PM09G02720 [Panicum miliaceum]|uniref:Uncharacterized protein n=1 Tax=Panicum miliaceum TaxID=4540 RepID=A0A3L6S3D5_PANMI|nr:hypothetical protein C2845_PM09G02720 [Panicum miliaceum]